MTLEIFISIMRLSALTLALTSLLFGAPRIDFSSSSSFSTTSSSLLKLSFSSPLLTHAAAAAAASAVASTNFKAPGDVVLTFKHKLGRIKSSLDTQNFEKALALMESADEIMKHWKKHVKGQITPRDSPNQEVLEVQRDVPAEFNVKATHVPDNCRYKTKLGSKVKVHFVGKLLKDGKKGKAFDSSFHTGSMPYKFILGDGGGAKVEGWNQGLIGMCSGERRTLTVPHTLGYGEKGIPGTVPPFANLLFMIEMVEFSGGERVEL